MKISYLNPPYSDLSIENEVLRATGIELIACPVNGDDDVIHVAHDADAVLTAHVPITARIVDGLRRCKVVVRLGVAYEIIDIAACRNRGILVCNVPDSGTEEVANHAHALVFAVHRGIRAYDRRVRDLGWGYKLDWPIHRLSTLRVGVLGLGRIGGMFARGMKPFVREVIAFDPFLPAEQFLSKGVAQRGLPEIFETCDVISLHLPLNNENHHLICDATIAQMIRTPIIINVSRGGLIDSAALARALGSGQIAGAGIDVFEDEPHVPTEFLGLENIILSPHVGWYSEEANVQLRQSSVQEIVRVLTGAEPKNRIS